MRKKMFKILIIFQYLCIFVLNIVSKSYKKFLSQEENKKSGGVRANCKKILCRISILESVNTGASKRAPACT